MYIKHFEFKYFISTIKSNRANSSLFAIQFVCYFSRKDHNELRIIAYSTALNKFLDISKKWPCDDSNVAQNHNKKYYI